MKRRSSVSPSWHNRTHQELNEVDDVASSISPALPDPVALTPATAHSELRSSTREVSNEEDSSSYTDGLGTATTRKKRRKVKVHRSLSHVVAHGPAFPRSVYEGWTPPVTPLTEASAITRLLTAHEDLFAPDDDRAEFVYFQLDDFCIYRPPDTPWHELELVSLDKLSQDRYAECLFDGILSVGEERCYVRGVPFRILTVDGYGESDSIDLANQLCIQSPIARRNDVWYKLAKPSVEYRRFYTPFLWLARFTKHFVDYLLEIEKVTLHHFKSRFHQWLTTQYDDHSFETWLAERGSTDFCTTVAANFGFLFKECYSIDFDLCEHPLWSEVDTNRLTAIPEQPNLEPRTVVTPYAYECFRSMYFGDQLEKRELAQGVVDQVAQRKHHLRLTPTYEDRASLLTPQSLDRDSPDSPSPCTSVAAGDVLRVRPGESSEWRSKASAWFVYVQRVRTRGDSTRMDVLWLYQPKQTTLGKAFYPFHNELFMSDHCECGKDALDLECVIDKVEVSWFARDPYVETGFFVRQKYRTVAELDTYDFVALQRCDFTCQCDRYTSVFDECRSRYDVGSTVLIRELHRGADRLQPAQIVKFDEAARRVYVRQLMRKSERNPQSGARPNELILTNEVVDKPADVLIRRCHVRFFTTQQVESGNIATPYDRNGTGDFWFIVDDDHSRKLEIGIGLFPHDVDGVNDNGSSFSLPPVAQGWDPQARPARPKLTGMGIFCGGGTFDRGLEEGGAVKFRYAVDWAEQALHSYRANVDRPEDVEFFLGSVDDYLAKVMSGIRDVRIAPIGGVHMLSAGSPCPGFSTLQSDRNSQQSRRNASMVASVVSYVDLYVPQYLVLENVVNMTNSIAGPNRDENVFSQILAALVGLGYQVQQFLMDAWSYGSSQNRYRVFIVASVPGLPPVPQPDHSHAHPPGTGKRSLGNTDNNLRFGRRRLQEVTPFNHVSAAEAVADLPYVGDAQPHLCTQFPEHRTATLESISNRLRMAAVPVLPTGMGLIQAKNAGLLRGQPLEYCSHVSVVRGGINSKMYARIRPDGLFPTIITKLLPQDGVAGRYVHWNQHRVITIMEAKRAQGFLDHEVLVGTIAHQMKIVGNSVDRKVALVLGLALRESWMNPSNAADEEENAAEALGAKDDTDIDIEDTAGNVTGELEDDESQVASSSADSSPIKDPNIDNRSAKMALLGLTEEDLGEIRIGGFKAINRIFAQNAAEGRPVHLTYADVRAGGAVEQSSLSWPPH